MERIAVNLPEREYGITVGSGLIGEIAGAAFDRDFRLKAIDCSVGQLDQTIVFLERDHPGT